LPVLTKKTRFLVFGSSHYSTSRIVLGVEHCFYDCHVNSTEATEWRYTPTLCRCSQV